MSYNLNVRYKLPASRRKRVVMWVIFLIVATAVAYLLIHGMPASLHLHWPWHTASAKPVTPVAN